MFTQVYYLLRSRADGNYLVAHLNQGNDSGYLLMFREHFDALSYLSTHGQDVTDRFAVESIPGNQLKAILERWGFVGLGMVQDPLLPKIEFLAQT